MVTEMVSLFDPAAEVYERYLVPAMFRRRAEEILDLVGPRPGERVLDVACGTGIVTRTAARRVGPGGTVVGYDVNPEMIAVARDASEGSRPAIDWEVGDAISMPFADASFDVVVCQQGAQFFADRQRGLKELHRVVAPRGRVAVSAWLGLEHHEIYRVFDDVLACYLDPEVLEGSDSPFSLPPGELRGYMEEAGFEHVHLRTSVGSVRFPSAQRMLEAVGGAYAPIAAATAALARARRDELLAELGRALEPWADDDGIVYPVSTSIALGRP